MHHRDVGRAEQAGHPGEHRDVDQQAVHLFACGARSRGSAAACLYVGDVRAAYISGRSSYIVEKPSRAHNNAWRPRPTAVRSRERPVEIWRVDHVHETPTHFADTPSPSLLKHLLKVKGGAAGREPVGETVTLLHPPFTFSRGLLFEVRRGCSRVTVSPTGGRLSDRWLLRDGVGRREHERGPACAVGETVTLLTPPLYI